MNFEVSNLSSVLKQRRKLLKLKQVDLAEMAGVSLHTIIDLESGKGNPTLGVLSRVLGIVGMELVLQPKAAPVAPQDALETTKQIFL